MAGFRGSRFLFSFISQPSRVRVLVWEFHFVPRDESNPAPKAPLTSHPKWIPEPHAIEMPHLLSECIGQLRSFAHNGGLYRPSRQAALESNLLSCEDDKHSGQKSDF